MKRLTIVAVALAIGLAAAASPFASAAPDGLNRVAADHGFSGRAHATNGYAVPGVADARVAKGLAGFGGTLLVLAAGWGVARAVRR
jgi:hypothetical protein